MKALEDALRDARIPFFGDRENYLLDDGKPNTIPSRPHPAPRQAVLGDFVKRKPVVVYNSFDALMDDQIKGTVMQTWPLSSINAPDSLPPQSRQKPQRDSLTRHSKIYLKNETTTTTATTSSKMASSAWTTNGHLRVESLETVKG